MSVEKAATECWNLAITKGPKSSKGDFIKAIRMHCVGKEEAEIGHRICYLDAAAEASAQLLQGDRSTAEAILNAAGCDWAHPDWQKAWAQASEWIKKQLTKCGLGPDGGHDGDTD